MFVIPIQFSKISHATWSVLDYSINIYSLCQLLFWVFLKLFFGPLSLYPLRLFHCPLKAHILSIPLLSAFFWFEWENDLCIFSWFIPYFISLVHSFYNFPILSKQIKRIVNLKRSSYPFPIFSKLFKPYEYWKIRPSLNWYIRSIHSVILFYKWNLMLLFSFIHLII